VPPVAAFWKLVNPPELVMTVALPAVLEASNSVNEPALVVMVALPAVLVSTKNVLPPALLVMVAAPAVLEFANVVDPPALFVMVALPAVLVSMKNVLPPEFVMTAAPAVLEFANSVNPLVMLFESMDRGDSLANLNVTGSVINALAYGSRLNGVNQPDVFYVGTDTNIWHRVTLGGPITSLSSYPGSSVRALAMSPQNYKFLVVVDDQNRVWSSSDEGITWSNLTDNLPGLSSDVRGVVVLVTNSNVTRTLVAGRNGVFNGSGPVGARWVQFRPGLPHALFWDIHYNNANDVLVASALGRGAWTLTGFFTGAGAAAAVTPAQTTKTPLRLPALPRQPPKAAPPRH